MLLAQNVSSASGWLVRRRHKRIRQTYLRQGTGLSSTFRMKAMINSRTCMDRTKCLIMESAIDKIPWRLQTGSNDTGEKLVWEHIFYDQYTCALPEKRRRNSTATFFHNNRLRKTFINGELGDTDRCNHRKPLPPVTSIINLWVMFTATYLLQNILRSQFRALQWKLAWFSRLNIKNWNEQYQRQ